MGYWVETEDEKVRIFNSSLKDAYSTAAKLLLGFYRRTNGQIHKVVKGYHGIEGIKIYDTARGKACNHWVKFYNGSNPKDGYCEVWYDKRTGIGFRAKSFPKNW